MVDQLAREYDAAGEPVVFIEYNASVRLGNRRDRWYAAYDSSRLCGVPLVMVDSGWEWTCGDEDFRWVYRTMVDQELARPAAAELAASFERSGNDLSVSVHVTNRAGVTLGRANSAAVNVIVFERARVMHTERYARAASYAPIVADLADGESADYRLELADVQVGRWDRTDVVVLVDYRPDRTKDRFVALQAAIARPYSPTLPTPVDTATLVATAAASPTASASPTSLVATTGTPTETPRATATTAPLDSPTPSPTATPGPTRSPSPEFTPKPPSAPAYLPFAWWSGH